MPATRVRGFVARCEAAATWRASLAGRLSDADSLRTAQLLRSEAAWAEANTVAADKIMGQLAELGLDFSQAWSDSRDYTFTTFGLAGDESREDWLMRVLDTEH